MWTREGGSGTLAGSISSKMKCPDAGIHLKFIVMSHPLQDKVRAVSRRVSRLALLQGLAWLVTLLILTTGFCVWCCWGPAYAIFGPLFPPSVLGKAFGATVIATASRPS